MYGTKEQPCWLQFSTMAYLVSMSAACIALYSISATPTASTLIRWGWNKTSAAPKRSPPTLITRPSGSYKVEFRYHGGRYTL